MISRRGFGIGLIGSTALLGLGGALAWVDLSEVIEAATEACFPPQGTLPSAASVGAGGRVLAYIDELPPDVATQAKALFRTLEWMTLPTHGSRFSRLPVTERTNALEKLASSPWFARRLIAHSVKQTCAVGYWQSELTWAYLGYDGPLVGRTP